MQLVQMCSPIPHSKLDPLPASISSPLAEFPFLQAKPIHCKYCRKKHTIYVNFFRQMKLFFTAMALLTTMGQPSALMTRIMTLMALAAVQQLAPIIPRDPTGSTPVGSSSSWAKSLAGVRALFFTGLGPLPLFLGLLTSVAEPVCFLLALVFFCWIQLQLQKKVVLQPFLLKF